MMAPALAVAAGTGSPSAVGDRGGVPGGAGLFGEVQLGSSNRTLCAVSGCDDRFKRSTAGFCTGHYKRWRDSGDPGLPFPARLTDEQRFWSKVERKSVLECWAWRGTIDGAGYGAFSLGGRSTKAHRMAYAWVRGNLRPDLTIDHLCVHTWCVNPWHMEQVTASENTRRRLLRRTHCKAGHRFSASNTRHDKKGNRVCRACIARYQREYRAPRKQQVAQYQREYRAARKRAAA